jgi:hypothetical protein
MNIKARLRAGLFVEANTTTLESSLGHDGRCAYISLLMKEPGVDASIDVIRRRRKCASGGRNLADVVFKSRFCEAVLSHIS